MLRIPFRFLNMKDTIWHFWHFWANVVNLIDMVMCKKYMYKYNKQRKNSTNCCKHGDAVTWLARQRRNCASLIQILHSYSIGAKKKIWFIISTEQRKYRARAMQWTCWAYQSSGNMELCLFKGGKWRADGRKPKPKIKRLSKT